MSTRSTIVREPVAAAAARFEARARAARWRARRPLLVLAAVALVLVVFIALSWFGPVLDVRTVQVSGVPVAQAAQVRAVGVSARGTPLPRVDAGRLAHSVKELPFVADVRVERGWPSTLRLVVTARTAVAAVPSGKKFRLIDATGVAFDLVAKAPSGVPVVRVPVAPQHTGAAGGKSGPTTAADTLDAVLKVLDVMPPSLRARISKVSAQTPDDVRMKIGTSSVVWGSADSSELKARVLEALVQHKANVYDVSSPHTPTLR